MNEAERYKRKTTNSTFGSGAQCNCGGVLYERQEDLVNYFRCSSCGRVLAPNHPGRPESREAV